MIVCSAGRTSIRSIRAAALSLLVVLATLQSGVSRAQTKPKTIAIVQIAEATELDDIRRGVIDGLKRTGFADAKIVYENAQNDIGTVMQIAQRFVGMSPDLIVPIGTPVAQAIVRSTKTIPIILRGSAIRSVRAVSNMERPRSNVSGTRDFTIPGPQLDLIKSVMPNAKRIGILFNPGEAQSRSNVDTFAKVASERGMEPIRQAVMSSSEIYTSAAGLVGKVDAIWVPTDTTVATSFDSVVKVSNASKLPIFTTNASGVKAGAVGAEGLDWYQTGEEAGEMAAKVLNGTKPGDLSVAVASKTSLVLNVGVASGWGWNCLPAEWARLKEGQILFTYLHLASDPEQAKGLMTSG